MSESPAVVHVFGANLDGFHGGGNAGRLWKSAMRSWRDDKDFSLALRELNRKTKGLPYIRQGLIGEYCTLGTIGLQSGSLGFSYGIVTTERPAHQGIVTTDVLRYEIAKLFKCARQYPDKEFRCLNFGLKRPNGFSWWTPQEICDIWTSLGTAPENLIPPQYLIGLI
jgi:hypothetical protein